MQQHKFSLLKESTDDVLTTGEWSADRAWNFFRTYSDLSESRLVWSFPKSLPSLCKEWGIDEDDAVLFALAWKCNCAEFAVFQLNEFMLAAEELKIDSLNSLKAKTQHLRDEIRNNFKQYYVWMFSYLKPANAEELEFTLAIDMWEALLQDKWDLFSNFKEYLISIEMNSVSQQFWNELYEFVVDYNAIEEGKDKVAALRHQLSRHVTLPFDELFLNFLSSLPAAPIQP